ncbi:MAG: hypothetical protein K8R68_04070, partial [Bacteroidales bacterium]|nr:hypothetical protein [Bacteroidales bacterium]
KDKNLRGAKVKQVQKEPEEGSLDLAILLPLIMVSIQSGFAAAVVTSMIELLKGVVVENKETKTDAEVDKLRIAANERIEIAKMESSAFTENKKIEQQSGLIEFMIENGDKKVSFKFTKGDEAEQAELLKIIGEMSG